MQNADLILIPLLDGTFLRAQVDSVGPHFAGLLLTDQVTTADTNPKPLTSADIVALIAVTPNDIQWPVIGYDAVPRLEIPEQAPQDPAIAEALANAIMGLYPWDGFPDPAFFTSFLRNPATLPPRALRRIFQNRNFNASLKIRRPTGRPPQPTNGLPHRG